MAQGDGKPDGTAELTQKLMDSLAASLKVHSRRDPYTIHLRTLK